MYVIPLLSVLLSCFVGIFTFTVHIQKGAKVILTFSYFSNAQLVDLFPHTLITHLLKQKKKNQHLAPNHAFIILYIKTVI